MKLISFLTTLIIAISINMETFGANLISSKNQTKILQQLLKNYDKHILPSQNGDPIKVEVNIVINDFVPISELSSISYSMDFICRLKWRDHRLAFDHLLEPGGGSNKFKLEFGESTVPDKVWVPGVTFDNQILNKEVDIPQDNVRLHIHGDGTLRSTKRLQVELACKMDTSNFPFDRQFCDIRMLTYAYDKEHVDLQWEKQNTTGFQTVYGPHSANMIRMRMKSYLLRSTVRTSMLGKDHHVLIATWKFSRNGNYYIQQLYLPCMLIVILSWVGFWIDYRSVPARTALGIVTVLSMITFTNTVRVESPPNSGKSTLVDWYVLASFLFVFLGIVEFAVVGITTKIWKHRTLTTNKQSSNMSQHRKNNYTSSPHSRRESAYTNAPCDHDHAADLSNVFKRQLQPSESSNSLASLVPNRRTPKSSGMFRAPTGVALQELTKIHEHTQKEKSKAGIKQKVHARLYEKQKFGKDEAHVLDQLAKIIFPVAFLLFNIIYGVSVYFLRQEDNILSEDFIVPKSLTSSRPL